MAVPFLTQPELAKAQAEAEGFANGPLPVLNPANLNTQRTIGNPQVVPAATAPVPYYPSSETPNLQLSTEDMPSQLANNFVILDNAIGTTAGDDLLDNITGQLFSYQPLISGLFNIVIVATAVSPQISFTQAQVNFNVSYTDHAGPEFNNGVVAITDNLQPASINEAIYALTSAPITVNSSYVTFGIAGALPNNVWNTNAAFTGGTGTIAYGATMHQAVSGATAFFYGTNISLGGVLPFTIYTVLSGVDDGSHVWTDPVSGQTLTPNGVSAGTFTGPGFGVNMTQFVTGAFGAEMDSVPTTVLHLGPQVSGVPNLPSGRVIIAGPSPSLTHNYAWYDPVNGGVFVPTNPWTDLATRLVFPYDFHIRVLQIG